MYVSCQLHIWRFVALMDVLCVKNGDNRSASRSFLLTRGRTPTCHMFYPMLQCCCVEAAVEVDRALPSPNIS